MPIDLLTAARALIAIDSRSSLSDRAVVDYLVPLCRQAGLDVSLQQEVRDGVRQYDLVAVRGPGTAEDDRPAGGQAALLLATHLDTVPPGDPLLWTETGGRPFDLTERDGLLFGLGTADVKLDFLCKLAALERLRDEALTRGVVLAGTYGEEVGRWGASLLARALAPLPALTLVGEPTGLRPCTAHKGYVEIHCRGEGPPAVLAPGPCWSVRFGGVTAHSSQPHKGLSANDACLDALTMVQTAGAPAVLSVRGGDLVNKVSPTAELVIRAAQPPRFPDAAVTAVDCPETPAWSPVAIELLLAVHRSTASLRAALMAESADGFDPPYSTVNNGIVDLEGGSFIHIADVRRAPGHGPETAVEEHLEALRRLRDNGRGRLDVEQVLDSAPFATAEGSRLLSALDAVLGDKGLSTERELKSGTTEAPVYAQARADVVVFGPGVAGGNIHKPNEHVPMSDLYAAVDVYSALIRRVCG
jgi:acetylornithine deacetylase/succinyl-diaminopimelate desuccinylase-like protein